MTEEKNKNIKLITGNPKKAIIKLAYPMAFTLFLMMLYNLADSIWVAGLGSEALAAIGFVTPVYWILLGIGNGIGSSANSLIARNIGAEDYDQANNAALHSILLSAIISIIITAIMLVFMIPILEAIGAGSTIQYALDYSYVLFGFMIILVLEEVLSSIFIAEGDVHHATIAIAISAITNMILDPIFIYVFNLGMAGAAWATIFSSALACIVMIYWIWVKNNSYLDLSPKNFNFKINLIIENLNIALPSSLETTISSSMMIILNSMLNIVGGSQAVGAYNAAMKIILLGTLPIVAIGIGVITVTGVAYGSKKVENLKIAHSYAIKLSLGISFLLMILIIVFAPQITLLFTYNDPSSYLNSQIANIIPILSFYIISLPFGAISSMTFQGMGKGVNSLVITLLRYFIMNILFAYLFCFIFGWGENGVYAGFVFGTLVGGLIGYIWVKLSIRKFEKKLIMD